MYIDQLEITGFGVYADLLLNPVNGLNIILGPNEAGKSTCHEFIRFVLYGLPSGAGSRLHPRHEPLRGGEHGGSLELVTLAGQSFRLSRKGRTPAKFQLIDEQGEALGPEMLANILGQTGSDMYNAVFAFSINELYDLNALDPRQVPDVLCGINFGLGNISVSALLRDLDQQREKLYKRSGSNPALNSLFRELRQVEDSLAPLLGNLEQYLDLERKLAELDEQDRLLQAELDKLLGEQVKFKTARRLFPLWRERGELAEFLRQQPLAVEDSFRADDPARLEHLQSRAEQAVLQAARQGNLLAELREKLARPEPAPALLEVDDLLADLHGRRGQFTESSRLLPEKRAELEAVHRQIRRIEDDLNQYWTYAEARRFNFSKDVKEQLEQLLGDIRQSEHDAAAAREEYGRLAGELEALAAPAKPSELPSARVLGEQASRARALRAERERLQTELRGAETRQLASRRNRQWGLALLGVYLGLAVGLGAGLTLNQFAGLFSGLALFTAFAAGALILPGRDGKAVAAARAKLESVAEEMAGLQATLDLPDLDEASLRQTDRLREVSLRAEQLKERLDTEAARAEVAGNSFNGLSLKLREFLTLRGISPDCSPGQVRAIMEQVRDLQPLLDREISLKAELARLDRHLEDFSNGLSLLLARTGSQWAFAPEGAPDPLATLDSVQARVQAAKAELAERRRLEAQAAGAASEQAQLADAARQAREAVLEFARARGLDSPEEFAAAHVLWRKRRDAAARVEQLGNEVASGAGENLEAISHLLSYISEQKLDSQLANLAGHCQDQERLLKDCREERGRLRQQRDSLLDERQYAALQFRQAALKEEIAERAREWTVLSLARQALAEAKAVFEQERQPEVMRLASGLFREITGGEYAGISPASEPGALTVLTAKNEPKIAAQLSRGAREQLFLAMRLALIRERGREAEPLPVLLDDILVNFDPERARLAAGAVLGLAADHQIFFFTCHPHTAALFAELGDTAGLPVSTMILEDGRVQVREGSPAQV